MSPYPVAHLPLPPGFQRTVAELQPDGNWHCASFDAPYRGFVAAHGRDELVEEARNYCAFIDKRDPRHYWSRKIGARTLEVVSAPDSLDATVGHIVQATTCVDEGFFLIFVGGELASQGLSRFNALVMAANWLVCDRRPQEANTWARWKDRRQIEILVVAAALTTKGTRPD